MFRLRSFCEYQTRLLLIGCDFKSDPMTSSEGERCLDLRPGLPVVALVHGPLGGVVTNAFGTALRGRISGKTWVCR